MESLQYIENNQQLIQYLQSLSLEEIQAIDFTNYQLNFSEMNKIMKEWEEKDGGRIKKLCPVFFPMIEHKLNNVKFSKVDACGLRKHQVSYFVEALLYKLADRVKENDLNYAITVGSGKSSTHKTPILRTKFKKVLKNYAIPASDKEDEIQFKITPQTARTLKLMREISKNIKDLKTFESNEKIEEQQDMIHGFAQKSFQPLIIKLLQESVPQESIRLEVWKQIVNLTTSKIEMAKEKSRLSKNEKELFEILIKFSSEKPNSLKEFWKRYSESNINYFMIYTYSCFNEELKGLDSSFVQVCSPSDEKFLEILQGEENFLIRFDDCSPVDNGKSYPLHKKLRKFRKQIDKLNGSGRKIIFLFHVDKDFHMERKTFGYHPEWLQFMIEDLYKTL